MKRDWTSALLPMLTDANRYRWHTANADSTVWKNHLAQTRQGLLDVETLLQGPTEYQSVQGPATPQVSRLDGRQGEVATE